MSNLLSRIFAKFQKEAEPGTLPVVPWRELPEEGRKDWIIAMLKRADESDPERKAFGARTHQYRLNPPADADKLREMEQTHGFKLPEDYFWFLTQVGDGGAGPNHGLYSFGSREQEADFPRLGQEPVFGPRESKEAYARWIAAYEDDGMDDAAMDGLWRGMLTIGTAGCTYDMMLVISGPDRGRILHVDRDLERPYYSPDASFLDWYARWLEESAAGYDMTHFDSRIGGNADELTARYAAADDAEKGQILQALFKFRTVEEPIVQRLARLYGVEQNQALRDYLMRHLYRFRYAKADDLLREALRDEKRRTQALIALWGRYCSNREEREDQPEYWYREVLDCLPAVMAEPGNDTAFRMGIDLVTQSVRFHMEDLEPLIAAGTPEQQNILFNKCSPRAMPLHTALCYVGKLEDSCRGADMAAIGVWMERCARIYYRNPSLHEDLGRALKPICSVLRREVDAGNLEMPKNVLDSIDLILDQNESVKPA